MDGLGLGWQSQAGRLEGMIRPLLKTAVCGSPQRADRTAVLLEQLSASVCNSLLVAFLASTVNYLGSMIHKATKVIKVNLYWKQSNSSKTLK